MFLTLTITGLVFIFSLAYYYMTKSSTFWKKRGVKGPEPQVIFGNTKKLMLMKESMGQFTKRLYDQYPHEKVLGVHAMSSPVLIMRDLDLIKDVLIRDFSNFAHRGFPDIYKADPLLQNIFFLEPERWRPLRTKLSPVFTSGKLKEMFYILTKCCKHFENYLEKTIEKESSVEVREICAKFTTDVIGNAIFGLEMNALTDEDSKFRKMGRKFFNFGLWQIFKFRLSDMYPKFYNTFWCLFYDYQINNFFINSVKQTMQFRDKEKVIRHDFIDVLRDMKANPEQVKRIEITDEVLAAQAFMFFIAGFETSSSAISHAVYELAQNQEIQEKLYQEITKALKECDGSIQYENLKNMKYLQKVFQETLRIYPAAPVIVREAKEAYTFSGTNVTIPAKQKVWIPLCGIQRDKAIFPDPEKFDPERFDDKNAKSRHSMSWIPFGDGPRNCVGERFGVIQTKLGLVEIMKNYRIDICEKTVIPYDEEEFGFLLKPKGGTWVKLIKRE